MRTGIYVQKPTTVTIRASAAQDARVQLRRFQLPTSNLEASACVRDPVAVGTHQLDAGIYLVVSSSPIEIVGDSLTTQIVPRDKDTWPDPDVVARLVSGATPQQIQEFFGVTKGIEVGDDPQESTEPLTKVDDDPDAT